MNNHEIASHTYHHVMNPGQWWPVLSLLLGNAGEEEQATAALLCTHGLGWAAARPPCMCLGLGECICALPPFVTLHHPALPSHRRERDCVRQAVAQHDCTRAAGEDPRLPRPIPRPQRRAAPDPAPERCALFEKPAAPGARVLAWLPAGRGACTLNTELPPRVYFSSRN